MRVNIVLALALSCAGCGWMFPDHGAPASLEDVFGGLVDSPCPADADDAHRAATADDSDGGPGWELWVVDGGDEIGAWVIAQLGAGDAMEMAGSGCIPPRGADEVTWFGGAASGSSSLNAGRLPDDAVAVQLDGEPPVAVGDSRFSSSGRTATSVARQPRSRRSMRMTTSFRRGSSDDDSAW